MIVDTMISNEGRVSREVCYSLLVVCLLRIGDREAAGGLLRRGCWRGVRGRRADIQFFDVGELQEEVLLGWGYNWIGVLGERGMDCVDSDVYSCLLAGLCEKGHLVEAMRLGERLLRMGFG